VVLVTLVVEVVVATVEVVVVEASVLVVVVGTPTVDDVVEEDVVDVLVVGLVVLVELLVLEVLVGEMLVVLELEVLVVLVELVVLLVELLLEVVDEDEVDVVLVGATVLLVVVELVDVLVVVVDTVVVVEQPGTAVCWQPLTASQVSVVQAFPSSQLTGVPPHRPAAQTSAVVQAFASSHGVPSAGVCVQPLAGSQASVVQTFPSSQLTGLPRHTPAEQTSAVVQALPSSHDVPLGATVCVQTPA